RRNATARRRELPAAPGRSQLFYELEIAATRYQHDLAHGVETADRHRLAHEVVVGAAGVRQDLLRYDHLTALLLGHRLEARGSIDGAADHRQRRGIRMPDPPHHQRT